MSSSAALQDDADGRPLRTQLRLLGGFELRSEAGDVLSLPSRKGCALLALLATRLGREHTRERVASLLWPDSPGDQARASLRQALAAIRRVVGADAVRAEGESLALRSEAWWVDADRLAERVARAREDGGASGAEIASLYRGPFLDGWTLAGDEASDWLLFERTRCRQLAQSALERAIDDALLSGARDEAVALAHQLVGLDPLREESHRRLIRLFVSLGDRAQALSQFEVCKAVLSRDLGVSPSPETYSLVREVLTARGGSIDSPPAVQTVQHAAPAASVEPSAPSAVAIAVLPFACDPDTRMVADGFAADLVTELSRVREFHVIAWQSSHAASSRPELASIEGAQLGARYALCGQLSRDAGRLRLRAQLIDVATNRWLWAERYDQALADLFTVEDEIVASVAGHLDARLRHQERERAARCSPEQLDAWGLVHRALWHVYRFTPEDVDQAQGLLERALQLTPDSAAPHAGLGYVWLVRVIWGFVPDIPDAVARGLVCAERAVALAPDDAFGHTVLGRLLGMAGRVERGLQHTELAVELNPSFAPGHYGHALALTATGRAADGLHHARLAMSLSPRDPLASMFLTAQALCQLALRDEPAAERSALRAIGLNPREIWARLVLAAARAAQGAVQDASGVVAELKREVPMARMATFGRLVRQAPAVYRERLQQLLQEAGLDPAWLSDRL